MASSITTAPTTTITTRVCSFSTSTKHVLTLSFTPPPSRPRNRSRMVVASAGGTNESMLGDFGARDALPEELESNFGEKVLGFMSTEHKILIPAASALSLSQQNCAPVPPSQAPLPPPEAKQLLFKVLGWRLVEGGPPGPSEGSSENLIEGTDGSGHGLRLRCVWRVRDGECGAELMRRVRGVWEECGHHGEVTMEGNEVKVELWSDIIGGLSLNDFIVAAKIDQLDVTDLIPRKRVWA